MKRIFARILGLPQIYYGVVSKTGESVQLPSGELVEHTTFRKDVDTDGRNATVEFAKNLEEDLLRYKINTVLVHTEKCTQYNAYCLNDILEEFSNNNFYKALKIANYSCSKGIDAACNISIDIEKYIKIK